MKVSLSTVKNAEPRHGLVAAQSEICFGFSVVLHDDVADGSL